MNSMFKNLISIKNQWIVSSIGTILFFSLFFSTHSIALSKSPLVLENEIVKFVFEQRNGGLITLLDKQAAIDHIQKASQGQLLWQIAFCHGTQKESLTNLENPATLMRVEMLPDGTQRAIIEWAYQDWWREKGIVTIRVTVDLPKDSGLASWRINVQNKSDYWGLWTIKFPYVNGFLESGKYDVAVPRSNWGFLYKNCTEELDSWYPEWTWPMQFLCAMKGNSSIYMATHDPQCWIKKYSFKPGKEFYFEHYVEDMGVAGSDFPAPYPALFGVYKGDWFDASKIYRKWVLKDAPWTREGELSKRTSVPVSVKDLGLWMLGGSDFGGNGTSIQEQDQPLKDAQSYFGVPIGYHWYNWHETPFDNNYPHFFPARAGFEERVRDLVSAGLLIMPYINGWAIDDKIPDYDTFYPYLCKTESGTPFARIFGTASGRLTVMCPTTNYWHRTIVDLVDRLGVMGLNSVYIDCIASVPPTLCFDKSHGHPLGGGHWWVDGYRELLRKVQEVAHRDGRNMVITSECNEEMFMDGVDAFLVWIKRDEREIPMISAVYSGHSLYFASPHYLDTGDRSFVMCQGRDFLWGCQNGWMGFDLFKGEHLSKAEYLKKVGQYRITGKKFLTYGELVDMVQPQNQLVTVSEIWKDQRGTPRNATLPSAMATIWKSEDGHLGVFMTNFLEQENTLMYKVNPRKYGLPLKKGFRITRLSPEGETIDNWVDDAIISRTEALQPREIKIIEIAAE